MALELEAKHILYFALLPVDGGQSVSQRRKLGLRRGHRHAQNEEPVRRIQRKYVIEVKRAVLGAAPEIAPRAVECPWKLGAMVLVAAVVIGFGFWLPAPLFDLVQKSVNILGGTP